MDNKTLIRRLEQLGLSFDEAVVYLKLLEGKSTHLRLSRDTGITRSKIYRLVESLEKKALATRYADDTGQFVTASSPENLSIGLTAKEEQLKEQRDTLNATLPALLGLQPPQCDKHLTIRTYEGVEGLRQMLWRELKAEGELLVMGPGTIEELTSHPRLAERLRAATLDAGYRIRELVNEGSQINTPFTSVQSYQDIYEQRYLPKDVINLSTQITIYNSSVNIYHWQHNQKVGVILEGEAYADMMRQIFELYWQLAPERTGSL